MVDGFSKRWMATIDSSPAGAIYPCRHNAIAARSWQGLAAMSARLIAFLAIAVSLPGAAQAAALDGATLSWAWELPFVGILLTIAFAPLVIRRVWHHHYGKFAFVWAVLTLAPLAALRGVDTALAALAHALLGDYLGVIAILFALYVVAGGIVVAGTVRGTALVNALTLLFGTLIASAVGTTGAGCVLSIFVSVDLWFFRQDRRVAAVGEASAPIRVHGIVNLILLAVIIGAVHVSALWKPGVTFTVYGTTLALQDLLRDTVLLLTALASLWLTPDEHREANGFSWEPILEVAILFAGIFVCAVPILAMLDAGHNGAFGWLLTAVTAQDGSPHVVAYFWLTGVLSAILDNAPTYLVFFQLAGGNASELMGPLAPALTAISMGAVYMGALTYIGNAPNFMIYAIASERGIKMPSFFGFMAWSIVVLTPVFAALTYLFILAR